MKTEYSADFISAIDGLTTAVEYALEKFRDQDSDIKSEPEAQQQGSNLRQINRLMRRIHESVLPDSILAQCKICKKKSYVEKVLWQGTCWECESARSN